MTMKKGETEIRLLGRMTNLAISCLTREEAVAVAARFLPRLFPAETGAVFLRAAAEDRYEVVTSWGEEKGWRSFAGSDCWSLRRRRLHSVRRGKDQPVCPHTDHDPEQWISICIPMTSREDVLGVFHLLIPLAPGAGAGDEPSGGVTIRDGAGPEGDEEPGAAEEYYADGESGAAGAARRRLATLTADILTMIFINLQLRRKLDDLSVRDGIRGVSTGGTWRRRSPGNSRSPGGPAGPSRSSSWISIISDSLPMPLVMGRAVSSSGIWVVFSGRTSGRWIWPVVTAPMSSP